MAVLIIKFFIMKVKVLQRNVYYKVATIEIEIPDSVDEFDVQDYVNEHEELWVEQKVLLHKTICQTIL